MSELTLEKRQEAIDGLMRPFDRTVIKTRKGGQGKDLSYIDGTTAIRRLIEVLDKKGISWDFRLIGDPTFVPWGTSRNGKEQTLLMVKGSLTVDGFGTKEAYGVQVFTTDSGEDIVKGAGTDALKKCATMLGLAIDLYGEDLEAAAAAPRVVSSKKRAADLLKAQGVKTEAAANKAANERFGKTLKEISEAEAATWVKELEVSQPVPF